MSDPSTGGNGTFDGDGGIGNSPPATTVGLNAHGGWTRCPRSKGFNHVNSDTDVTCVRRMRSVPIRFGDTASPRQPTGRRRSPGEQCCRRKGRGIVWLQSWDTYRRSGHLPILPSWYCWQFIAESEPAIVLTTHRAFPSPDVPGGRCESGYGVHGTRRLRLCNRRQPGPLRAGERSISVAGRAKTSQRGALKTGQCFDDAYTSSV